MGKNRFAPHTRRFANVPSSPGVYVAEIGSDMLKVGATSNLRGRMMSLQAEAARDFSSAVKRVMVMTTRTAKAGYEAETHLLRELSEVAVPVPGRREWFAGIEFDSFRASHGLQFCQAAAFAAAPSLSDKVRA
jgi:hypothetical protein